MFNISTLVFSIGGLKTQEMKYEIRNTTANIKATINVTLRCVEVEQIENLHYEEQYNWETIILSLLIWHQISNWSSGAYLDLHLQSRFVTIRTTVLAQAIMEQQWILKWIPFRIKIDPIICISERIPLWYSFLLLLMVPIIIHVPVWCGEPLAVRTRFASLMKAFWSQ